MAILLTPSLAMASTVDELQAQINALLAQLAQLQGGVQSTSYSACGVSVSTQLKEGVYSTDVINLQKILNSDPYTMVAQYGAGSPGNETMYFGPSTKMAVMRFQQKYASEVLYPQGFFEPTGFVGYSTIAKLNSVCKTGSNTSSNTTNTNNNQPQTNTGNSNNSNSNLNGNAGYITITKYNTDVENTVTTGGSENVLSFKVKSDGSDVRLTNLRLELNKYNSDGSTYPNRYFKSFEVYADDNRVGNIDIDDFSRDSSGHYSTTIRLEDVKIKMGSSNQTIFKIKARSADYMDSANGEGSWQVTVSNFRYRDASGANLVENSSITSQSFKVEKLSSSGDVKVKISSGSSNPDEKTVFVSDSNSGDKVTLNEFKVRPEGTKITFDVVQVRYQVTGTTNVLSDKVTELQLVRDDRVIATIDPYTSRNNDTSSKVLTFNLDDQQNISDGSYATYKIVARMKKINTSTFAIGDSITVSVESANSLKVINAEDRSGDAIWTSRFSGSSTGKPQIFRSTGINISKTYSNADSVPASNSGSRGYGRFTTEIRLTASGNEIWVPLTTELLTNDKTNANVAGVLYQMENGYGNRLVAGDMNNTPATAVYRMSGGSVEDNYVKIADGESATIRLQVSYDPKVSGFAKMQIVGVNYKTSRSDSSVSYIQATPASEFETNAVDVRI